VHEGKVNELVDYVWLWEVVINDAGVDMKCATFPLSGLSWVNDGRRGV
jgi:hypothetical protein